MYYSSADQSHDIGARSVSSVAVLCCGSGKCVVLALHNLSASLVPFRLCMASSSSSSCSRLLQVVFRFPSDVFLFSCSYFRFLTDASFFLFRPPFLSFRGILPLSPYFLAPPLSLLTSLIFLFLETCSSFSVAYLFMCFEYMYKMQVVSCHR